MSPWQRFFSELRRRHVFRVAAAYAIVAWIVIQIAATTFPFLGLPDLLVTAVIALVLLGFPIALVLAWAFEITPEGVRRAEPGPSPAAPQRSVARGLHPRAAGWVGVGILVGLASVGTYGWVQRPDGSDPAEPVRSLAVLPFANLSSDPENEYFSDGVSEEILNALAQLEGLRVPARSSSFQFREGSVDVREVGRKLNVGTVLEGSVRKAGDRVRITVQLVDAGNGFHLWSESYDRELSDIFAVQEDIARSVVAALRMHLDPEAETRLARRHTEDVPAHDLYLRGRHLFQRRTRASLEQSIALFERALDRDPRYALAFTGIADAYVVLLGYGHLPPGEALPRAERAAERAIAIDGHLAEAHTSLGGVRWLGGDYSGAEAAFQRAMVLNPGYAQTYHWYSNLLGTRNRLDEAVEMARRALQADPLSPNTNNQLGLLLFYARDYPAAAAQFTRALEIQPAFAMARGNLARAYLEMGRLQEAEATLLQLRRDHGRLQPAQLASLGIVYAATGREREAKAVLDEMQRLPQRPVRAAVVHTALRDFEGAFRRLEGAELRGDELTWLRHEPRLAPLRSDARFAALLAKVGLTATERD